MFEMCSQNIFFVKKKKKSSASELALEWLDWTGTCPLDDYKHLTSNYNYESIYMHSNEGLAESWFDYFMLHS